jgi:peptidoglycan hydrolase-like protein with peptidoglycan-binding domain
MQKLLKGLGFAVVAIALLAGAALVNVDSAEAITQAQANAIIAALGLTGSQADLINALVTESSTPVSSCANMNRDLTIGAQGSDVADLQAFLVADGKLVMPAGVSMGYFGPLTRSALAAYQAANGIAPAVGYFGPITRANIAAKCAAQAPAPTTPTTPSTGLQGGAGDIAVSSTSVDVEKEVAEGSSENVLAFRVEAEDSDVEILNIRVMVENTDAPNSNRRPDRYLNSIDIYMGSTRVGSVDPSDLSRDGNEYSRNVTLSGAVVREGLANRETFYVVFRALNNIDSLDMATADFDVTVENIRFRDGSGAILTSSATATSTGISFTDPASQGDVRIRVSLGSGNPTERIVEVNEFSTTNNITLLEFRLKAEARDMLIESLDIDLDASTSTANLLADLRLMRGSTVLADVSSFPAASSTHPVTFDLYDDLSIEEDETVTLRVVARLLKKDTNFNNGDTLRASLDTDTIVAEDKQGNEITNTTGSANGYVQSFYVEGAAIEYVSDSSSATNQANTSRDFKLVFDVTAIGADLTVNRTSWNAAGVQFSIVGDAVASSQTLSSNASLSGGIYTVFEGQTRRFTLTVNATTSTTSLNRIVLDAVAGIAPVETIETADATINQ